MVSVESYCKKGALAFPKHLGQSFLEVLAMLLPKLGKPELLFFQDIGSMMKVQGSQLNNR